MTTFWTQLEEHSGARLEGEHCYFDSPSTETNPAHQTVIAPLSHYGFLRVKGPDASKFLQGQTTADFRLVTPQSAQRGAYCTPKGRMVTSFLAASLLEHDHLLRMRLNIVESSKAALAKYAVFSKAELTDASTDIVAIGVAGPRAGELIAQIVGESPSALLASAVSGSAVAVQIDDAGERFELWLPASKAFEHWQALAINAAAIGSGDWEAMNINDAIAEVCAATAEEFIPQMLNYDAIGAVNFKKGCYTGQEVVARLHYRGTAKRRLYRASLQTGTVSEGDEVFAGAKPQAVGIVASTSSRNTVLVVLARDALNAEELRTASGAILGNILPPPYALKDEN